MVAPVVAVKARSLSPPSLPDDVDAYAPLSSLISDHEKLASAAVSFVGWKTVETMLPPCLQGRSRDDIVQLVSDELDGMSRKRICCILEGKNAVSSSSSSEVSVEDEQTPHSAEEQERHLDGASDTSSDDHAGNTSSYVSEVRPSDSEQEQYSDIELIEGLDADASSLPDVT
ncbi:hypothetical protein TELCIR_06550 [Teladorsagia circumcincta]|uniref:Uncharacterized protein n=1 Tax=Teladorsagia circumcincta TaxID=45464 RepID=A0A2G9UMX2_TELCI|nr:hypothetical protein TELCIR_06550 [Teladorsagia circumcincta]